MKRKKPLFTGLEWDIALIEKLWKVIDKLAKEKYGLDYYPPRFEITTAEQMIDAYTSHGMPTYYNHWSFGKLFAKYRESYEEGKMGLAYEMVINSNPSIAYLMEDNTACMQALVIAHASCGHSHFFKNNYLFRQHTNANTILDYLEYAKKYIFDCENKYGIDRVVELLDLAHVLQDLSVNRYAKLDKLATDKKEEKKLIDRLEHSEQNYNELWNTLPKHSSTTKDIIAIFKEKIDEIQKSRRTVLVLNEENILQVVENHSIVLNDWQKGILRIVRNMAQYFYPQYHTKVMNEGFACFIHYQIMKDLQEEGHIDEGAYLEFLQSHTSVCCQQKHVKLNPYSIGFEMFMDIKRACLEPDEEDYKWLPDIAGSKDYMAEIKRIVKYYKDESFVLQYLSPKVIRKLGLFTFSNNPDDDYYEITGIQNDEDIYKIRKSLSESYELDNYRPYFEVSQIDRLDNVIEIRYHIYKDREIDGYDYSILADAIERLTGFECSFVEKNLTKERG